MMEMLMRLSVASKAGGREKGGLTGKNRGGQGLLPTSARANCALCIICILHTNIIYIINNRNLFLRVLGVSKSKVKTQKDSVPSEGLLPGP